MPFIQLSQSVGGVAPYERWDAGTAPALSAAGTARVYFDSGSNTLKLSQNGGAYLDLATGSSSPWNNTTTAGSITENTLTNTVLIGTVAAFAGRKVQVQETAGNKGLRAQSAAAADNVLDWYDTVNAQAMLSLTGQDLSIFGLPADTDPRARLFGGGVGTSMLTLGDGTAGNDATFEHQSVPPAFVVASGLNSGNLIPKVDGAGNLGNGTNQWLSVWATKSIMQATAGTPAAVPGSGVVYTKTVGLDVELFYRSAGGAITQLTPFSATSPWQRAGLIVNLDVGTDTQVNPATDDQTQFGTKLLRWNGVFSSATQGFQVFNNQVGPAACAILNTDGPGNGAVYFGAGGAAPLDTRIRRDLPLGGLPTIRLDASGPGGVNVLPGSDDVGFIGRSTDRWRSVNVSGSSGLNVFNLNTDTAAAATLTVDGPGFGALYLGPGAATASDARIHRDLQVGGLPTIRMDDTTAGGVNVFPGASFPADNIGLIGNVTNRWSSVATGPSGYQTWSGVGPNPTSSLTSTDLSFGAGGVSAPDVSLTRGPANTLTIGASIAQFTGNVLPLLSGGGNVGTAGTVWGSVHAHTIVGGPSASGSTISILFSLAPNIATVQEWGGGGPVGSAPALSPLGSARAYFDTTGGVKHLMLSENGGAYAPFGTTVSIGWTRTAQPAVILTNINDFVSIGAPAATANRKVTIKSTIGGDGTDAGIRIESASELDNVLDYLKTGDAVVRVAMDGTSLKFGGGALVLDIGLARSTTLASTIEVTNGAAASGNIQPLVTATGKLGTTGVANSKAWQSVAVAGATGNYGVYLAAADANPLVRIGRDVTTSLIGAIEMGAGGVGTLDVGFQRFANKTMAITSAAGTSGTLVPLVDGSGAIGTNARRFASMAVGVVGGGGAYDVYTAAGDTTQSSHLTDGQLVFGPGGAAPLDVRMTRSGIIGGLNTIRFDGNSNAVGINLFPASDNLGRIGGASDRWATISASGQAAGTNGFFVYGLSGDANPTVQVGGTTASAGGFVRLGKGGINAMDVQLQRVDPIDVNASLVLSDGAGNACDLFPASTSLTGIGQIGSQTRKWALVRAQTITSGDVCFDDQTCVVCGQPFAEGDDLVLRVIRIEPDGNSGQRLTRTVPAHHGCR